MTLTKYFHPPPPPFSFTSPTTNIHSQASIEEIPHFLQNFLNKVRSTYKPTSSLHDGSDNLLFRFEFTNEAALHNAIVLQCYNFDLNLAIQAQQKSQVFMDLSLDQRTASL